ACTRPRPPAGPPRDGGGGCPAAGARRGAPGHGAPAAAHSWLDAFTRWRRARGLTATTIAWGPWTPTTTGSPDPTITAEQATHAFQTLLRHDRATTGYTSLTAAPWLTAFAHRSSFAEAFRADTQNSTGSKKLRAELDEIPPHQWPTRLRRLISDQVSLILRRDVDPDRPLPEYGMDSLGAHELRTRLETETGIRITSTDLAKISTIRGLAELLHEKLTARQVA
ncbi:acyl carrier protein, partial [Mycobacterium sp. 852002-51163_SCH5372311]|uniref:acyl carrier protein n=1 Tax=Mycobacterium sp. 852002-51163_SCH5372311 TaxID=1834097 RepID=UPI000AF3ACB8